MNRARMYVFLGLAAVVVAFAASWLTVQSGPRVEVPLPAWLFTNGLGVKPCVSTHQERLSTGGVYRLETVCDAYGPASLTSADTDTVKERIVVVYASAAVVFVLLGLAFGAARRRPGTASS